jgi:AcrR family transcriptional regulator
MIDAAERLVAERGLRAVSLREVQVAAGQRNKSAAQYHFGSLHGLIEAIVDARMRPIDAGRRVLLDQLDAEGRGDDVRALLEASIDPFARATLGRSDSRYARFLTQIMSDPDLTGPAGRDLQADGLRRVHERLFQAMADVPVALRRGRIRRVFVLAVVSTAALEGGPPLDPAARAIQVADLVDSCVAVIAAPASDRTLQALAADTAGAGSRGTGGATSRTSRTSRKEPDR